MPKDAIIKDYLDREKVVYDEIIKHGEISQNKLLRIIVDVRKLMAKTTFEKTLKALSLKQKIQYRKEKNRKIYFGIEPDELKMLIDLENFTKKQNTQRVITSQKFATFSLMKKIDSAKFLFSLFIANMSINKLQFLMGNQPKNQYDKTMRLTDENLKFHLSIWQNDKDSKTILPELIMSICKSNPFFAMMLDALEEGYDLDRDTVKKIVSKM